MIRSALRSVRYLAEDVVSVARWAVGELAAEVDYRCQPAHVRHGWAAALTDLEAEIESFEPDAGYRSWGGPETWPRPDQGTSLGEGLEQYSRGERVSSDWLFEDSDPYCMRCGCPHPTDRECLRDVAERLGGGPAYVRSSPPTPLSLDGCDFIECTSPDCTSEWGWGADRSKLKEWAADHNAAHRRSSAVLPAADVSPEPPTGDSPEGLSSPNSPSGHPHYKSFVPEADRVPTSKLLREAADYIDAAYPLWYVNLFTANLRNRADAFQAIEDTA